MPFLHMLCKLLWINPVGSILIQWCCSYWFYSLKILFLVLGRKTSKSDWYSFCHLGRNYSWCVSVIHFKISGMLGTVLLSVSIYLYKRSKQKKGTLRAEDAQNSPSSLWGLASGIKAPQFLAVWCVARLSPG